MIDRNAQTSLSLAQSPSSESVRTADPSASQLCFTRINPMKLQAYLFFDGRCEEAIEFYKKAIGAEVQALMRFKENPEPQMAPPGSGEKVMHANVLIGGEQVMMSDGQCLGKPSFAGF